MVRGGDSRETRARDGVEGTEKVIKMASDIIKHASKKDNSRRRFKGGGPRPDRRAKRQAEARERQAQHDAKVKGGT